MNIEEVVLVDKKGKVKGFKEKQKTRITNCPLISCALVYGVCSK